MATCSISGCPRLRKYIKSGLCQTHYHRWWRHGDTGAVKSNSKGDNIAYRAAHARIAVKYGKASSHTCVCGEPAAEWSYRGKARNEKVEVVSGRACRYSPDPCDYDPLCRSCHLKRDRWGSSLEDAR